MYVYMIILKTKIEQKDKSIDQYNYVLEIFKNFLLLFTIEVFN